VTVATLLAEVVSVSHADWTAKHAHAGNMWQHQNGDYHPYAAN